MELLWVDTDTRRFRQTCHLALLAHQCALQIRMTHASIRLIWLPGLPAVLQTCLVFCSLRPRFARRATWLLDYCSIWNSSGMLRWLLLSKCFLLSILHTDTVHSNQPTKQQIVTCIQRTDTSTDREGTGDKPCAKKTLEILTTVPAVWL